MRLPPLTRQKAGLPCLFFSGFFQPPIEMGTDAIHKVFRNVFVKLTLSHNVRRQQSVGPNGSGEECFLVSQNLRGLNTEVDVVVSELAQLALQQV